MKVFIITSFENSRPCKFESTFILKISVAFFLAKNKFMYKVAKIFQTSKM